MCVYIFITKLNLEIMLIKLEKINKLRKYKIKWNVLGIQDLRVKYIPFNYNNLKWNTESRIMVH